VPITRAPAVANSIARVPRPTTEVDHVEWIARRRVGENLEAEPAAEGALAHRHGNDRVVEGALR
jgi:hypothetical protein